MAETCKHLLRGAPDCVFCHRDQLLGELSLAQEGLANYEEEVVAQIAITRKREAQIAELNSDLTAARLELEGARHDINRLMAACTAEATRAERLNVRVWALATLLYPYVPPREAVAGDIGWVE